MVDQIRASTRLLSLIQVAVLLACPIAAQTPRWTVVEELRIGRADGAGPDVFGSVRNVFADAFGRAWVLDSRSIEMRLFDEQGQFVRAVGRRGDGPGEFGTSPCAFLGLSEELWVESARRWESLDSAGAPLKRRPVLGNVVVCGERQWTPDGRFVVQHSERDPTTGEAVRTYVTYRMGPDGELVADGTFAAPALPEPWSVTWARVGTFPITRTVPFSHRPRAQLGPTGDLWITAGEGTYEIRRQTLTGAVVYMIRRPHTPVRIPEALRNAAMLEFRVDGGIPEGGFDEDEVPREYPPFDSYFVARDGTLFVRRHIEGGRVVLDIFAPDGRYLAEAAVPDNFGNITITDVVGDKMYGFLRDELDLQYPVRLGIRRTGR